MKQILFENQFERTIKYCQECQTLFDYQNEDIETIKQEYNTKCPDIHCTKITTFVCCPKCGKEHIISEYETKTDIIQQIQNS